MSLLDGVGSPCGQSDTLQMKEALSNDRVEFQDRICIEHIEWKYADDLDYVLKDISLEIHKGEAVGIIGNNSIRHFGNCQISCIVITCLLRIFFELIYKIIIFFSNCIAYQFFAGKIP